MFTERNSPEIDLIFQRRARQSHSRPPLKKKEKHSGSGRVSINISPRWGLADRQGMLRNRRAREGKRFVQPIVHLENAAALAIGQFLGVGEGIVLRFCALKKLNFGDFFKCLSLNPLCKLFLESGAAM